jgi:hypothetical protein
MKTMQEVFVQRFAGGCPKDYMEGTKEYPFYLLGYSNGVDKKGFFIYHTEEQAKSRPGIRTPSILKNWFGDCRVNILIGRNYFRNIAMPIDGETKFMRDGSVLVWRTRVIFVGKVKAVRVRDVFSK